jgi:hypothetical protein
VLHFGPRQHLTAAVAAINIANHPNVAVRLGLEGKAGGWMSLTLQGQSFFSLPLD